MPQLAPIMWNFLYMFFAIFLFILATNIFFYKEIIMAKLLMVFNYLKKFFKF